MSIDVMVICACPFQNRAEAMRYLEATQHSDSIDSEEDQLQRSAVCQHRAAGRTPTMDGCDDDGDNDKIVDGDNTIDDDDDDDIVNVVDSVCG
jgi:hypothetical protein